VRQARRVARKMVIEELEANPDATDEEICEEVCSELEAMLGPANFDPERWMEILKFVLELIKTLRELFADPA